MGKKIVSVLLLVIIFAGVAAASDTMLMFVGEDLEVMTIASRREEAAWSAPAIADVITRENIEKKGAFTLAQALDDVTGFYIEKNEKGSAPYLRGIPDSVLFLYDTIPLGSGVQKSSLLIDREISLASVKRIEVIRGTGSVLWGPDAFAGVVNVVPMTGIDFQGVKAGGIYSSLDQGKGAYLNYGKNNGKVAYFLSVSGISAKQDDENFNVINFWNDGITPAPIDTRYGSDTLDDSHYVELYYNIILDDWLTLSARLSDSKKAFVVSDWDQNNSWEESISSSRHIFKVEASRTMAMDSGIRFTGYFSGTNLDHGIVDTQFDQKEQSFFGELIYDRSFFSSKGLVTLGTSWRKDRYDDIPIFQSFYPEFFIPENLFFLPEVEQSDFRNELFSFFGQYRHKLEHLELWAGARRDNHGQYADRTSYNLGFAYSFSDYMFKSIYGTAYRTPFAKLLDEYGGNNLEEIKSLNFQLSW
ncbi:MAG: TonB-dependent receptor plug domain-containing protein, partial [Desulfobacula sp.]|nr:TonB-dependent receptor plug domain-containing protein [Desulfobacula sp.]